LRSSLLLLLLSFCVVFGQEPYSLHLTQANGLPSNNVFSIFQDSKGFIWFATNEGISSYDGFEYKNYQSNLQSLKAGSCIKEDKFGRIWYENFDGQLFYVQNSKLIKLNQYQSSGYFPFGLTKDNLFVIVRNGLDIYPLLQLGKKKNITISNSYLQSATDDGTNFYCISQNTIYYIDQKFNIKSYKFRNNEIKNQNQIYTYQNYIVVSSKINEKKSLYIFSKQLKPLKTIQITAPKFIQGVNYIDNSFWVSTTSGILLYTDDVSRNGSIKTYYQGKSISAVIKDRQNNYWFSTTNDGVFMIPDLKLKSYPNDKLNANRIIKAGEKYIIGSKDGSISTVSFNPFNLKQAYKSLDNLEIYKLYVDSLNGNIFSSAKGIVFLPNSNFKKLLNINIALKDICRLDDKYYAVAASGYCGIMLSPTAKAGQKSIWDSFFNPDIYLNHKIPITYLMNFIRGKAISYNNTSKAIYFSSNAGTFKKTLTEQVEIRNKNNPYFADKLICYKDLLYSLSSKGELFRIKNDRDFELLNPKSGLIDSEIKFLKKFDKYLYLIGKHSIHALNLENQHYEALSLPINPREINDIVVENKKLLIITNSGIIESGIDTEDLKKSAVQFNLNSIKIGGKYFNPTENPVLNYTHNDVTINYSIIDFGSSYASKLYYRINTNDWKIIPNETRTLQFPSLSSGKYCISFKIDNVLVKDKVIFGIEPPFWLKWWFIISCTAIILFLGFSYYSWHINILSKQINLLQDKVELEENLAKSVLTSIRAQMNPHFFYNALNTIQAYIFTNDKRNASLYLGKFSKLTRMILEMSENDFINLEEEIQALTLYLELEKIRFDDDFNFFIYTNNVDLEMTKVPPMLIQPFVENAVKHGLLHKEGIKSLTINFFSENDFLKVIVEDDGVGRAYVEEINKIKEQKHKPFAIKANKKRLEILNNNRRKKVLVDVFDKHNEHSKPIGTIVVLYIPLSQ
jgi:hypothetical protein